MSSLFLLPPVCSYQFNQDRFSVEMVTLALLKAMMQLPENDFTMINYLIPMSRVCVCACECACACACACVCVHAFSYPQWNLISLPNIPKVSQVHLKRLVSPLLSISGILVRNLCTFKGLHKCVFCMYAHT